MVCLAWPVWHAVMALALANAATMLPAPTRLRVEYLENPLSIDTREPRFSWALPRENMARDSVQSAYRLVVLRVPPVGSSAIVWDTGVVQSNQTLNVPFGGSPSALATAIVTPQTLASDTDYSWSVTWFDAQGASSTAAHGNFTVAILGTDVGSPDWHGAEFVSSLSNGSLSTYRTTFALPGGAQVARARLYIVGLGYAKTWVNGNLSDTHELGQYVTFQERVLYDSVDVQQFLRPGENVLGVMLGHGWLAPRGEEPGVAGGHPAIAPRQFMLLLSVTTSDGRVTYFHSSAGASVATASRGQLAGQSALTFVATTGPVQTLDMYKGEHYDGRIAAALEGWSRPYYNATSSIATWVPATPPVDGPATWNSQINAHHAANIVQTKELFTPVDITRPAEGKYVFDFGQVMSGQVTLRVADCPAGTVISLQHAEVLQGPHGLVRNSFCLRPKYWLCGLQQFANYTCSGIGGVEEYRVTFTSMGFRYVQVAGFPGIPVAESLTAHFIHSDVPRTGQFISSSPLLNAIQHATVYSAASNQMDIPTDCPQRERQGWLGDAQLAFDTVQHNFDGGAFYAKWVRDLGDAQTFIKRTRGADGAMPDQAPFYSTSLTEVEADPGWGIAAWVIPAHYSSYYDDEQLEQMFYPHQRAYMEHWITLAQQNNETQGELPPGLQHSGDWGCMQPGPTDCAPQEYSQYFYVEALRLQAECSARLGFATDATRYRDLLKAAQQLFMAKYFDSATGCFGNCTDISQIFGLTLAMKAGGNLLSDSEEAKAWAKALEWFGQNGKYAGRFGGGIVSLKLLYPLLDAHGMSNLGLQFQLHTDKPPSFGFWISQGATTLSEYWGNAAYSTPNLLNSYNHIMYGGSGSWYYSTLAGLQRAPGSRSWRDLIFAPPAPGALSNLTWANASIDTPMGLVSSSWSSLRQERYTLSVTIPPNAHARVVVPTPTGISANLATVTEGENSAMAAVWEDGCFIPGVQGVKNASIGSEGQSIVLEVGSGSYVFVAIATVTATPTK